MTPAAFTEALRTIGWTQRHLAELLRCDTNLPTRWATGRAKVPVEIGYWLKRAADWHRQNPAPAWRVRGVSHLSP